jgi:UPF0176 protein
VKDIVVSTFYKFVDLPNYKELQVEILGFCKKQGILGTILLAQEGINATISGTRDSIDSVYDFMKEIPAFSGIDYKESSADFFPFKKMKVRLKEEIVRFRVKDLDMTKVGDYLSPEEWDKMLTSDDKVILIDTRNDYEYAFGTFKGAINPETKCFSELVTWVEDNLKKVDKDTKVMMCCTGGIRCEKSTAYVRSKGFPNVYHLKGGILEYLKQTNNQAGLWQGECYVFDDRVAVDANLTPLNEEVQKP